MMNFIIIVGAIVIGLCLGRYIKNVFKNKPVEETIENDDASLEPWDLSSLSPDEIINELRTIAHTSVVGMPFSKLGTVFGHTAKSYTTRSYKDKSSFIELVRFPEGSDFVDCISFAGFSKQTDGNIFISFPDKYCYFAQIIIKDRHKAGEIYEKAVEIYKSKIDASENPRTHIFWVELSGSRGEEYFLGFDLNDKIF